MSDYKRSVLRVFLPFALGYFLSYLFRVVNAVIAPDLAADLDIDPSQLGLLTATYFIAFASSQLPLGILLDRFGPRKVESFLLIFTGIGALVFATSQTLVGVIIGRAFIGFGVSACLMAAFKSYVIFFPERLWPRINGFQMAAGGMGALCATTPVQWMMGITDWRGLFFALSGVSFCVALLVFFLVPEKKGSRSTETLRQQLNGIKTVFKSMNFWQIAPLTTFSQAGFLSVQGLWAGPWLRDVAGLSRPDAAQVLFWTAVSMIAGFIILGFLAEKISAKGVSVKASALLLMGIFTVIQVLIALDIDLPPLLLWGLFGFFGTSGILAYSALSLAFPKTLSGRVTTGINMLVFVAAFALQWAIGVVINLWEVSPAGHYHPSGYGTAFVLLAVLQAAGLLWGLIFHFFKGGSSLKSDLR
jgi:sugar phosphate permease